MFLYKNNIWFILGNLILLYYWVLSSEPQYKKYWQSCFNAAFQHRWRCVGSTFLFNLIPTLKQHWVINIEITSTNIRRLNFHFQPNINVETTLMNVGDQRCFKVDVFAGKQFRILLENLKEMDNSSWDWCIKSHKHGQTPKYFP